MAESRYQEGEDNPLYQEHSAGEVDILVTLQNAVQALNAIADELDAWGMQGF